VTYTLSILGSGHALTLTDDLPVLVSAPDGVNATSGSASYNAGAHRITWLGAPSSGQRVTATFPVTVLTASPAAITNRAVTPIPLSISTKLARRDWTRCSDSAKDMAVVPT
jgi:hypothetical protein